MDSDEYFTADEEESIPSNKSILEVGESYNNSNDNVVKEDRSTEILGMRLDSVVCWLSDRLTLKAPRFRHR